MTFFVILLIALSQYTAHAKDNIPDKVISISKKFNLTMNQCPEKIWDNYSWKDAAVIFIDNDNQKSYIWHGPNNTIKEYNYSQLPDAAKGSYFKFFELNGIETMTLNMNTKDLFALGVHELFHFINQYSWISQNPNSTRGTLYPMEWKPRYYRRMIFERLKEALITDSSLSLQKANFWYQKWRNQYPDEFIMSADVYEGTAEYAETIAKVLAKNGCEASDKQLKKDVIKIVNNEFGDSVQQIIFSLDSEGYDIGGLATVLLRLKSQNTQWQKLLEEGVSPLEILLSSYSSVEDKEPVELKQSFRENVKNKNSEMGQYLDYDLSILSNPEYVRLAIPFEWNQTHLSPRFFAVPQTLKTTTVFPLARVHNFLSVDEKSSIQLSEDTVLFLDASKNNPCQKPYALIRKNQIISNSDIHKLESIKINGTINASYILGPDNYEYLCPTL